MLVIGVTGGIGSGKTEVCQRLAALGLKVLNADQIAREISESDPEVRNALIMYFGEGILNSDGLLNRRKLGELVFSNEAARRQINQIIHPRVLQQISQEIEACRRAGDCWVVIIEAALIYEVGMEKSLDGVVVVDAPVQARIDRIRQRDGLTRQEIENRIKSQMPLEEKVKRADFVVDNSGSISDLEQKVKELVDWLKSKR